MSVRVLLEQIYKTIVGGIQTLGIADVAQKYWHDQIKVYLSSKSFPGLLVGSGYF